MREPIALGVVIEFSAYRPDLPLHILAHKSKPPIQRRNSQSSTMATSPHTGKLHPTFDPCPRRRRWTLGRGNKADTMAGTAHGEGTQQTDNLADIHPQQKIFHQRDVHYRRPKRLLDRVDERVRDGPKNKDTTARTKAENASLSWAVCKVVPMPSSTSLYIRQLNFYTEE
jgi:hypothetical protein